MERVMLKSKIHRATLTGKILEYEGSISVDEVLLREADILPGEQVHVLNVNNGARLVTYAIAAEANSGTVLLNGPAARLGETGDIVVLLTYANFSDAAARTYRPVVVRVDSQNRVMQQDEAHAGQT
jgi:aspartate 1-decarboxylase